MSILEKYALLCIAFTSVAWPSPLAAETTELCLPPATGNVVAALIQSGKLTAFLPQDWVSRTNNIHGHGIILRFSNSAGGDVGIRLSFPKAHSRQRNARWFAVQPFAEHGNLDTQLYQKLWRVGIFVDAAFTSTPWVPCSDPMAAPRLAPPQTLVNTPPHWITPRFVPTTIIAPVAVITAILFAIPSVFFLLQPHGRRRSVIFLTVLVACVLARLLLDTLTASDALICGDIGISRVQTAFLNLKIPETLGGSKEIFGIPALLTAGRVTGILTVVALGMLALLLFRSPRAGEAGAFLLACSPAVTKYAASTSAGMACFAAQCAAFLALLSWVRSRRRWYSPHLLIFVGALIIASQARPEAALFCLHAPLLFLVADVKQSMQWRDLVILAVATVSSAVAITVASGTFVWGQVRAPEQVMAFAGFAAVLTVALALSTRLRNTCWAHRNLVGIALILMLVSSYRDSLVPGGIAVLITLALAVISQRAINASAKGWVIAAAASALIAAYGCYTYAPGHWWPIVVLPLSAILIVWLEMRGVARGTFSIVFFVLLTAFLFWPVNILATFVQVTFDARVLPLWLLVAIAGCLAASRPHFGKETMVLLALSWLPVLAEVEPAGINFQLDAVRYSINASLWVYVFAGGAIAHLLISDGRIGRLVAGGVLTACALVALVSTPWLASRHESMQQYSFSMEVANRLPRGATLVITDDSSCFHGTWELGASIFATLNRTRPDVRIVGLSRAVRGEAELNVHLKRTYFLEGYFCAYQDMPDIGGLTEVLEGCPRCAWIRQNFRVTPFLSQLHTSKAIFDTFRMKPFAEKRRFPYRLLELGALDDVVADTQRDSDSIEALPHPMRKE